MYKKILKKHPEYFSNQGILFYNEHKEKIYILEKYAKTCEKYFIKQKEKYNTKEEKMFYDYLISDSEEKYNFFVLKNSNNIQIRSVLNEIIDCIILEYDNDLIVLYKNSEIKPIEIQQTLSIDFYYNCGLFEGGMYKACDIFYIYAMQRYFLSTKNKSNICDLILTVFERDHHEMVKLKKCILQDIFNDTQLEKIIYAFFESNLNATKTSQLVYMHRNTINNKLDYIKKTTSIDLTTFIGSMAMYILMKIK